MDEISASGIIDGKNLFCFVKNLQKSGSQLKTNIVVFFRTSQAEARAEFAERSVQKLQKEVDRLEGNVLGYIFTKECNPFSFDF